MIMINDNKNNTAVVQYLRLSGQHFYQDILHKNKTHKYLNSPKKHNKAHKLGDICPDNVLIRQLTKKIINIFLFKNKM